MSFRVGITVNEEDSNLINTPDRGIEEGTDKRPLFHIWFMEGGESGICGRAVYGRELFFISPVDE